MDVPRAAQMLGRRWTGIDITSLATALIKRRLRDAFGDIARYQVIGEPASAEDSVELAASDKYQFQWWGLGSGGARPEDHKKGADTDLRDLRGVIDREKADIGGRWRSGECGLHAGE